MPGGFIDLGPITPSHCTVCRAPIPKVEDPNSGVRGWARHLNYMNHLQKYHPRYYKWSKRWTYSLYLPVLPFGLLALYSTAAKSIPLLALAILVLGIPYLPLLLYRWRKVGEFRGTWSQIGEA